MVYTRVNIWIPLLGTDTDRPTNYWGEINILAVFSLSWLNKQPRMVQITMSCISLHRWVTPKLIRSPVCFQLMILSPSVTSLLYLSSVYYYMYTKHGFQWQPARSEIQFSLKRISLISNKLFKKKNEFKFSFLKLVLQGSSNNFQDC